MVVDTCNPSTRKVETRGPGDQEHSQLHRLAWATGNPLPNLTTTPEMISKTSFPKPNVSKIKTFKW